MGLTMMNSKLKRRKAARRLLLLVVLVLVAAGLGGNLYYQNQLEPVSEEESMVEFSIEKGSTLNGVIQDLEKQGLIKSAFVAKLYSRLNHKEQIKAGNYQISPSWNVAAILAHVSSDNAIIDQVMVTIPEGTWAKNIAVAIAAKTNVTAEELIALWSDKVFLDEMITKYDFLSEDIYNKDLRIPLEGFLYPETYYFYPETTPREVTIKLLNQTASVLSQFAKEIKESEYSIFELVTLASLVQFEANNPTDMALVAGIFYRRMDIAMPLQASASVCYAVYDKYKDWKDCEYNIDIKSPYNTYVVNALPVGPISNPGLEAYEAVFHPTNSKYLFFVSDVKGDRKNYYAETYSDHLKNIAKYASYLE